MPTYTANWFPATVFDEHLSVLKGKKNLRFVEVGVLEGQGTCYFFDKFLGETGTMVAIDPFIGYSKATIAKIKGFDHIINESLLERFISNTKPFSDRITLCRGLSQNVLPGLESGTFDLAFVDGDHSRDAVVIDARECFRLLKPGGYIVFDDYSWGFEGKPETSPKDAIDQFLRDHEHDLRVVHKGWVVIVQKLEEDFGLRDCRVAS